MKYLLTFFLLFTTILIFGQSQKKNDSLKILAIINKGLNEQDSITQLEIFKEALSTSKKLKSDFGVFTSYKKIAKWKTIKYNADSTISEYKKGLKDLSDNSSYNFYFLVQIGDKFKNKSNADSAVYYYRKSIDFGQRVSKKKLVVKGHIYLGNLWLQKFEYDKSFKNYAKADSICNLDSILKTSKLRAQAINYLGYNVKATDGYEKALEYYLKAREQHQKLNNEGGIQEVNIAIAQAYVSMKKYDAALKLLNKSVAYHAKYAPQVNPYSYSIIVRGFLLLKMKNFKEAEKDYKLYYDLAIENKNELKKRRGLWYLADFYLTSNQLDKSEIYTKKAIQECKKTDDLEREFDLIQNLIQISKKKKKFKETVQLYEESALLNKKIEEKNITLKTKTLETKYQTEKKEQEIALLKTQSSLVKQESQNQQNKMIATIAVISLIGLSFFILYKNKQKTSKKLQELDEIKSKFFSNISHEFRTPLTLISGPIQQQLKKKGLPIDERNNLEMMQRNSNRLLSLVDQLLGISKIESGKATLRVSKNNIIPFVEMLIDNFTFIAKQKYLKFKIDTKSTATETWFDKDIVEKIITNLLSNAIKYTPKKGKIKATSYIDGNQFYFEIKNTGKELSKEEKEKVFERFYQVDEHKQGTGIGLSLVKEIVDLHKGNITVESTKKWTTFKVTLPIDKLIFKEHLYIDTSKNQKTITETIDAPINLSEENSIDNDSEKPILLIVEDNTDVRIYIDSIFKNNYTIIQAENGQEGIDLAIEHVPDIIISDIMMPIKDGIELCKTLKTDERTSHIPIVLLTAKAGDGNKIIGAETGADDYITKPFNHELLIIKVKKLIEIRKKLQERYSQEVILKPTDISINSTDESFLKRMQTVLDKNLIESSFSIEEFSLAVSMSRMQLHRKLKALTGLSASEFIRSQRLKLAAKLLKKSDANVSQIGYSVGFNNPAYFSKSFKKEFGVTPTQYAETSSK